MAWIKNVDSLPYYTTPNGVDCYCHPILESNDLQLQGIMDFNGTLTSYSTTVFLYSPDGQTNYGGITAAFTISYGKNPNGAHFFTALLNKIASALCSHPCFVLRIQVKNGDILYFDYFTEQYCLQADCCDTPTNITFTQTGMLPSPLNVINTGTNNVLTSNGTGANGCEKTYLKLETFSDCYNNITNKYYKAIDGKSYKNIFNIEGRLKVLPYEIQRDNSLNCRLQRSQVTRLYELEGFTLFDANTMDDISASLTDKYIFIAGRRYEIANTVPFEPVQLPNQCQLVYKLKVQLQDCLLKQIFGCGDECTTNQQAFVQPIIQGGSGNFYGENKQYIGNTISDLKAYFQTYPNAGEVTITDLDPLDYNCTFAAAFTVEAEGYIPTSYYYNDTSGGSRIFGVSPDTLDVCSIIDAGCPMPIIGAVTNTLYVCPVPIIGAITNEAVVAEDLYFAGYGDWVLQSNDTTLYQNTVSLKFEVKNSLLTYDSGDPDANFPQAAGQIGYVSEAGWPPFPVAFTQANAPSMVAGASITVQADGKVFYTGPVTSADLTGSLISVTDIIYQI